MCAATRPRRKSAAARAGRATNVIDAIREQGADSRFAAAVVEMLEFDRPNARGGDHPGAPAGERSLWRKNPITSSTAARVG